MDSSRLDQVLAELSEQRARWTPPADRVEAAQRAAWANAGIEGNPLDWPQARDFLLSGSAPRGKAEGEVLGCLEGIRFLEDVEGQAWTPALISQLHGRVMAGLSTEAGRSRLGEARIVKESGSGAGEVVFKPPHALRVPELLDRLCGEAACEDEDPFLAAGRFHYEFQSIHPFADGNGRVGRLLSCSLARRGWISTGFHLAPAIRRAGPAYYLALRAVRLDYAEEPREGLLPWLLPWMDMMRDALEGAVAEESEA